MSWCRGVLVFELVPRSAYRNIFDEHFVRPVPRELIQNLLGLLIFDCATDGIVAAAEVPFGLKVYIGGQIVLRTANDALITQLIFHLAEEDAAGVHVGLRQDASPGI